MIFELETLVGGGFVFLFLVYLFAKPNNQSKNSTQKTKAIKSNRIPDKKVSVNRLMKDLKKLTLVKESRLKFGYTEKSIQAQLDKQLRSTYESVQKEYGLEGNNATKIDFNIGRGRVGIEVKLAKSVFKSSELQRLVGQLKDYTDAKFDNKNLIVLVAGEEHHLTDRVQLDKVKQRVDDEEAHFIFLEVGESI